MKTHARNTVNTNEFKDYIFHGNKPQTAKTLLFTAFLRNDFPKKNVLFGPFLASETSQDKEGGGTPPPPFRILNFKIFTKSKTLQFLELKTRPEPHFLTVFTMVFCTCLNFYPKKSNIKKYQKITKKSISCWWLAFLGSRPLPQPDPSQGPFLTVFAMFYAHRALLKKEPVFCLGGGGSAPPARLPIAKAKATPHAMRSNMPGIRCLVHRRIEGLPPMPPTPKTRGCVRRQT